MNHRAMNLPQLVHSLSQCPRWVWSYSCTLLSKKDLFLHFNIFTLSHFLCAAARCALKNPRKLEKNMVKTQQSINVLTALDMSIKRHSTKTRTGRILQPWLALFSFPLVFQSCSHCPSTSPLGPLPFNPLYGTLPGLSLFCSFVFLFHSLQRPPALLFFPLEIRVFCYSVPSHSFIFQRKSSFLCEWVGGASAS